jgi:guanylate kinase
MSVLLVLAGPSGTGKSVVVRRLLERDPSVWFSVSATDRARRPDEVDGRDYRFVSRDEFERTRAAGGFLEWFEVFGELKGTPRAPIEERLRAGDDVLVEVDVQGALAIRDAVPDAVLVFLEPPSRAVQRQRLLERDPTVDRAWLDERLDAAAREERLADRFDAVVVNDDLDRTVDEIEAVLEAARQGRGPSNAGRGPLH